MTPGEFDLLCRKYQTDWVLSISEDDIKRVGPTHLLHDVTRCVLKTILPPSNTIVANDSSGNEISAHYGEFKRLNAKGELIETYALDMIGNPLEVGMWVTYSRSEGRSGHALFVGKVSKVLDSGIVKVVPMIKNGRRVMPNIKEHQVNETSKSLILPFSAEDMTFWVLNDFERKKL